MQVVSQTYKYKMALYSSSNKMTYPYFTTGNYGLTFLPSATIGEGGHEIIMNLLPGAKDNKLIRIISDDCLQVRTASKQMW